MTISPFYVSSQILFLSSLLNIILISPGFASSALKRVIGRDGTYAREKVTGKGNEGGKEGKKIPREEKKNEER